MERRKVIDFCFSGGGDSSAALRLDMIGKKIHDFYRFMVNLAYPNVCAGCGCILDYNGDLCEDCRGKLVIYDGIFAPENTGGFAAQCVYRGLARDIVLSLKDNACGNAYYAIAAGISEALKRSGADKGLDVLTCIPMYIDDLENRGYNQTELIAKELRYMLDVPYRGLLTKNRKTSAQKELSGEKRRENVAGIFSVRNSAKVKGKSILLIDDVCTTGSTLSEAAGILMEAGAERVIAAAFAKTLKNDREEENEDIL